MEVGKRHEGFRGWTAWIKEREYEHVGHSRETHEECSFHSGKERKDCIIASDSLLSRNKAVARGSLKDS